MTSRDAKKRLPGMPFFLVICSSSSPSVIIHCHGTRSTRSGAASAQRRCGLPLWGRNVTARRLDRYGHQGAGGHIAVRSVSQSRTRHHCAADVWLRMEEQDGVLGSDTKRQGTCRRAERYVTCEWFVLPERRKRELAARSCLLRVDVVRKCRIADVVVHEAYMDDLHDLDMTDITVIAPAPAIPSTAPTGAPDDGDPDGGSCVQPNERGEMDVYLYARKHRRCRPN